MTPIFLAILGSICGFLGGLLLAIAAKDELSALRLYCDGAQAQLLSIVNWIKNNEPVEIVLGLEKHHEKGRTKNKVLTSIGIPLLALSLLLSVVALVKI